MVQQLIKIKIKSICSNNRGPDQRAIKINAGICKNNYRIHIPANISKIKILRVIIIGIIVSVHIWKVKVP